MRNKIAIGIFALSIVVLAAVGYLLWGMFQSEIISYQTETSGRISRQALVFGMRYYNIQLAFWRYVNDPNNGRLLVYDDSKRALSQELNNLTSVSLTAGPSLYPGGEKDIRKIKDGLAEMEKDISDVFKLASDYETAKQSGQADALSASIAALRAEVFATEKKFNQLGLDNVIINLNQSQEKLMDDFSFEDHIIKTKIKIGLLILAGSYVILLFLIAIFLIGLINEVKNNNRSAKRKK
jgi:hypothetical protein